jgi:hypothetical protein
LALRRYFCFITRGLHRHESIMYPATPTIVRFARIPTEAPELHGQIGEMTTTPISSTRIGFRQMTGTTSWKE